MRSKFLICLLFLASTQLWIVSTVHADDWIYHAKEGDTLWNLCLEYTNKRGCWIELQRYNNIDDDRTIPLGTQIKIPTEWLRFPPVVGSVLSVYGEVFYQISDTSEDKPLKKGQTVHLGAIISSKDGSARISLYPHSEVLLRPESRLELKYLSDPFEENQSLELYMDKGSVEATVEPNTGTQFQIETPAAIAAVRGTRYRTTIIGEQAQFTRTEVLTGSVEVLTQKSTLVSSGYGLSSSAGGTNSEPIALLPPPTFTTTHMNLPLPVELEWTQNGGESAWELEVFGAENESAIITTAETIEPHFEFNTLLAECYKVLIRAIDTNRFHGLENQTSICVAPQIATVADLSIDNNASDNLWTARWTPVDHATRYIVQLATDNSFQKIIETKEVTGFEARINPSRSKFFARVFAEDKYGNRSPASASVEQEKKGSLFSVGFLMYAAYIFML